MTSKDQIDASIELVKLISLEKSFEKSKEEVLKAFQESVNTVITSIKKIEDARK